MVSGQDNKDDHERKITSRKKLTTMNRTENEIITVQPSKDDVNYDPINNWRTFNQTVTKFHDLFPDRNEHEIMKSIFLETNKIAKMLKINHNEIPLGIFCSTTEDLKKMDHLMRRITYKLEQLSKDDKNKAKCPCFRTLYSKLAKYNDESVK